MWTARAKCSRRVVAVPKPAARRHVLDRQVALLQQPAGVQHALLVQPAQRRRARLGEEVAGERALAARGVAGHGGDRERLVEALEHPLARGLQAVAGGGRQRALDELRLAAAAMRRDDHPARDRVGGRHPVVARHDVQAEVDAGGHAGRREDAPLVDVEDAGVDVDLRVARPELGGVAPVRGRAAPVEQPRRREHEGARADRDHPRAAAVGRPQGGDDRGVGLGRGRPRCRGRRPCRPPERAQPVGGHDREARRAAHRPGAPPADGERVAVALVVVAEDLRGDREVEGDDARRGRARRSGASADRTWQESCDMCRSCHWRDRACSATIPPCRSTSSSSTGSTSSTRSRPTRSCGPPPSSARRSTSRSSAPTAPATITASHGARIFVERGPSVDADMLIVPGGGYFHGSGIRAELELRELPARWWPRPMRAARSSARSAPARCCSPPPASPPAAA